MGQADNSIKLDPVEVAARKVKVRLNLLQDQNNPKIRFNLPDGVNYEVVKERTDPPIIDDTTLAAYDHFTWYGKILLPNKNTAVSNTDTVIITVGRNGSLYGGIPAVVGVNKYQYSIRGSIQDANGESYYILSKIDPSKFGPD